MDYTLVDHKEKKRFEFKIENHVAFIEYILAKENIYLTHTEVPKELEGKGIASALVLEVFKIIERESWSLVPLCPFVASYIKRHPEWKKLVYRGINID